MKKAIYLISLTLMISLSACSSNSDDEPQNILFDWRITKTIWSTETGKCTYNENEYLHSKSEDYVRQKKAEFESKSTKYYKYKYAYKKLN